VITFLQRSTSLRVGGRAARLSFLRRGGGGRQAGAAVLSCLVWRCELALSSTADAVLKLHVGRLRNPTPCTCHQLAIKDATPPQWRIFEAPGGRSNQVRPAPRMRVPCRAFYPPAEVRHSLPPSPPRKYGPPATGLGEHCKLPQRGLGQSPSRNRIWCILA